MNMPMLAISRICQDPVVAALHREKLYGMWVPRVLGGGELGPVESLQVIENVAQGDPSAGWVLMAAALAIGTGGAYLGDAAAQELFGPDRFPVIAGQGTRPGTAISVDGGYSLRGSWRALLPASSTQRISTLSASSKAQASHASSCCLSHRRSLLITGM